jgi:glutathione synthase/RimK-type ligase-like ATP-grasp enzyme
MFNQRNFPVSDIEFEVAGNNIRGTLRLNGSCYNLEDFTGILTRTMDDQFLPELRGEPEGSPARLHARALHEALMRWSELAPARVVNRAAPMGSNFSKPYQLQLIRKQGFQVPETLITNDPELVLQFRARHGKLIYKSISGVRSIVSTLNDEDEDRLELIRWCPTQFQQFIEGTNVRVHTVGEEVFATAANTTATDYRYAGRQAGEPAELTAVKISDSLARRCVDLARALGLAFAGIDLKFTPEGEVYCFEVNPSPAFSYYESNTGQPIAEAVARYLAGGPT